VLDVFRIRITQTRLSAPPGCRGYGEELHGPAARVPAATGETRTDNDPGDHRHDRKAPRDEKMIAARFELKYTRSITPPEELEKGETT
jgi:hypothetical protein